MNFTPDEAARRRVAAYVRAEIETDDPFRFARASLDNLPDGVLDALLDASQWPAPEYRKVIEGALFWKEGDMEWIAQGGDPSRLGTGEHGRRWLVHVVVEREVEAPTNIAALEQVSRPIREAFSGGEVGIVESTATNMAYLRNAEARARQNLAP